ncbi:MAG: hypothetical protein CNCCGFBP_01157 [Fimbriimonadaceae bacterium]|nr:hypothetical protein [Fimbriimonadaceae bacterium]
MLTPVLLCAVGLFQSETYVEKLPHSTVEFKMVAVPGGKVKIGEEEVEVAPFYMAATETAWELFDQFLLSGEPSRPYDQTDFAPDVIARPSRSYILPDLGWGHQGYPVINVSHTNVDMFCRWLRSVTGKKYRLPTEAEWQLAAESGWKAPLTAEQAAQREWFAGNSEYTTHPVGKLKSNPLGLHDLLGNVGEWALDLKGKPVLCGGDFMFEAADLKPTVRRYYSSDWQMTDPQLPKSRWWLADGWFVGFRLVCDRPSQ